MRFSPLFLALVAAALPVYAQHRTVVDYFWMLPADGCGLQRLREDAFKRAHLDIPHGYLHIEGDGGMPDMSVDVFRRADGSDLIAVACGGDEGEVFESDLTFYELWQGTLQEISKQVVPERLHKDWRYALPEVGTTIHVVTLHGRPVEDWVWDRRNFTIVRR